MPFPGKRPADRGAPSRPSGPFFSFFAVLEMQNGGKRLSPALEQLFFAELIDRSESGRADNKFLDEAAGRLEKFCAGREPGGSEAERAVYRKLFERYDAAGNISRAALHLLPLLLFPGTADQEPLLVDRGLGFAEAFIASGALRKAEPLLRAISGLRQKESSARLAEAWRQLLVAYGRKQPKAVAAILLEFAEFFASRQLLASLRPLAEAAVQAEEKYVGAESAFCLLESYGSVDAAAWALTLDRLLCNPSSPLLPRARESLAALLVGRALTSPGDTGRCWLIHLTAIEKSQPERIFELLDRFEEIREACGDIAELKTTVVYRFAEIALKALAVSGEGRLREKEIRRVVEVTESDCRLGSEQARQLSLRFVEGFADSANGRHYGEALGRLTALYTRKGDNKELRPHAARLLRRSALFADPAAGAKLDKRLPEFARRLVACEKDLQTLLVALTALCDFPSKKSDAAAFEIASVLRAGWISSCDSFLSESRKTVRTLLLDLFKTRSPPHRARQLSRILFDLDWAEIIGAERQAEIREKLLPERLEAALSQCELPDVRPRMCGVHNALPSVPLLMSPPTGTGVTEVLLPLTEREKELVEVQLLFLRCWDDPGLTLPWELPWEKHWTWH